MVLRIGREGGHATGGRVVDEIGLPVADRERMAHGGASEAMGRHFGDSDELLAFYDQHSQNTHEDGFCEVGRLRPNQFGLFDMLGNVFEWSHGPRDDGDFDDGHKRSLLGGAFCIPARVVTTDKEERFAPTQDDYRCGFRVVRTAKRSPLTY
jgi:formylglycine-generating enzyme required for sulfatase activity